MSDQGSGPSLNRVDGGTFTEDDPRWALALRVATSRQFTKAPQLHNILIYICQRALADPTTTIKEHEIGCNVLGRKTDFNPNEDNIVRVQISHLRKKLDEYFATDGRDEPLRIIVPKGSYVPRFTSTLAAVSQAEPPAPVKTSWANPDVARRHNSWIPALAISTCVLALTSLYLWLRPPASKTNSGARNSAPVTDPASQDPFWSRIFGAGEPAEIVVADSCLVVLQDVLHTDLSLDSYLSRGYPDELVNKVQDRDLRDALQLIASRQYTSLGDLNIASRLADLSRDFSSHRAQVRFARYMNIRDFKTHNLILIGSRRAVPWGQLFEAQLNFSLEEDVAKHHFHMRNKRPKPGEPATYFPVESGASSEAYADVAFLPNLGNTGSVLILSGLTMESSEAAGEFVAGKDFAVQLAKLLGPQAVRDRYFEIALKTRAVAGAARSSQIVAYRIIQPGAN